ncbi:MAG: hypothetical protein ACYS8L_10685 [Planctomycetota bacterium]|jgi:hypothetical protein
MDSKQGAGRIFIALAAFLIVGAPFAYFGWRELSHLLAGEASARGILIMLAAVALLLVVARALKAYVQALDRS